VSVTFTRTGWPSLVRQGARLEELAATARVQHIASLDDVEWAILESGGLISFVGKQASS
jgi:uncharacterized membrane protein YcaP (DUF421 family)